MGLHVINNDHYAVEIGDAPEELDFWDVVRDSMGGYDFYPHDAEKAEALDLLIDDMKRLHHQSNELIRLVPATKDKTLSEFKTESEKIEKQIKKLMGQDVIYKQ